MSTDSDPQMDLCVALHLPETEDEIVGEKGLFHFIALACGAMANVDKILTINEFLAFAETADNLASFYKNPLLIRVLMLKAALDQNINFEEILNLIKKIRERYIEENYEDIFRSLLPIIKCQGDNSYSLANKFGLALGLKKDFIKTQISNLPVPRDKNWLSHFIKSESHIDRARNIALIFNDNILLEHIDNIDKKEIKSDLNKLTICIDSSFDNILRFTENSFKNPEIFQNEIFAAVQFNKLTEAVIVQTKYRLDAIRRRLDFESKLFKEDLDSFVEDSVCKVELEMMHLVNEISNWDDYCIWERFSQEQVYHDILIRWSKIAGRHEKSLELWSDELANFSKEIQDNVTSVLDYVDPRAFAGIVPTEHPAIVLKNMLDSLSDVTIGLAVIAGITGAVVTGIAAYTSGIHILSALPALLYAHPVTAISVSLILTGAIIWKAVADPSRRKYKLIRDKTEAIKDNLIHIIGNPLPKYYEILNKIMNNFNEAASNSLFPLLRLARLSLMQKHLEAEIMQKVLTDTKLFFKSFISEIKVINK